MVDVHSRGKMIQPEAISKLIIGGQTGADAIQFYFKDTLNGVNLANPAFSWFLQFRNKWGTGSHVALDAPVHEEGFIKLLWMPDLLATQVPGRLEIQIYATITEGEGAGATIATRWVSEAAVIYVQENLDPDLIIPTELSIFQQYLLMYQSWKDAAESAADAAAAFEEAAAGSESNAHDSEVAAAGSALAASTSESNAHDSEVAAAGSALAASTSESNAHDSEEAAFASAQAAMAADAAANKQILYDGTLYQYTLKQASRPGFIALSFEEVI